MSAAASSKRSPLTFFVLTLALASPFWILGSVVNASGGSDDSSHTMGNFEFEVALPYRRAERPRRDA